jgi:hypothetical protein
MRDIMFEESAADLEGGNPDEDDIAEFIAAQQAPARVRYLGALVALLIKA